MSCALEFKVGTFVFLGKNGILNIFNVLIPLLLPFLVMTNPLCVLAWSAPFRD